MILSKDNNAGGSTPVTPPSDVRVGSTVFLSTSGVDATAAREDLVFHARTIDKALSLAQPGDTIVIYPGTYTLEGVAGLSIIHDVTIFMHPGVTVIGNLFRGFDTGFKIAGRGVLVCTTEVQTLSSKDGVTDLITIECESIISLTGFQHYTGGNLKIKVFGDIIFTEDSANGFEFNDNGGIEHYFELECKRIFFLFNDGNPYCWRITNLQPSSYVIVKADSITQEGNQTACIYVNCPDLESMEFTVKIYADIISYSDNGGNSVVKAGSNNTWDKNSEYPGSGFYTFGRIIAADACRAIHLVGGKLIHTGDIFTRYVVHSCYLSSATAFGTFESYLILQDGNGQVTENPSNNFVQYNDVNNKVQFKNYKVVSGGFYLIDSYAPLSRYQCLSCYSNVNINGTNVLNEIAPTTLVYDTAILI